MAFTAKTTKPGDVIKSADFNEITNEVARLGKEKIGAPEIVKEQATVAVHPGPGGNLKVVSDGAEWSVGYFTDPANHQQCKCPGRAWGMFTDAKEASLIFALLKGGRFVFAGPKIAPRMVIGEDGRVGIGTASPTHALHVCSFGNTTEGGSPGADLRVRDTEIFDNEINRVPGAGNKKLHIGYRNTQAVYITNYQAQSDARLKKDVTPIPGALERVARLRGVNFRWKDGPQAEDTSLKMGLIAQEVEEVFPEVVSTDDKGMKAIAYDKLAGAFVEAVKELKRGQDGGGIRFSGEARLEDGRAEVALPEGFEARAGREGRTVQLTAIGPEPFRLSATRIEDGRFTVFGERPEGEFFWEVKAVRKDIAPIELERTARS